MTNELIFDRTPYGVRRIVVAVHDENIVEAGKLGTTATVSTMETVRDVGPDNGSSVVAILKPLN